MNLDSEEQLSSSQNCGISNNIDHIMVTCLSVSHRTHSGRSVMLKR